MRLNDSAAESLIKDDLSSGISCYREGAEIGLTFAKEGGITSIVRKYVNRIVLIGVRIEHPADTCGFSIGSCHAQYRIVLIAIGSIDHTLMIEGDAITTEINAQTVVGENTVAEDGIARAESDRDARTCIEGNDIVA